VSISELEKEPDPQYLDPQKAAEFYSREILKERKREMDALPDIIPKDEDVSAKHVLAAQNAYRAYSVLAELASLGSQEAKYTLNRLFEISGNLQKKYGKKEGK
jgi:hypothetical protein